MNTLIGVILILIAVLLFSIWKRSFNPGVNENASMLWGAAMGMTLVMAVINLTA